MINDILFCLLGYTGGVFIESTNSFHINETITCITNSEKVILKRISEIGFKYKILKDFTKNYNTLINQQLMKNSSIFKDNIEKEEILNSSVFLNAICNSIDDFLNIYENDIYELESYYLHNLNLTGSEIFSKLEHYVIKFDKIYLFLQYICDKNIKGGDFLNYLYEFTINGDPQIKNIFKKFFINANKMLINFVTTWIIDGTISNNEFFILTTNNCLIDNLDSQFNSISYKSIDLKSWNNNFYLEYNNIPFYFPANLAEDILFVGKAMKVLGSNKNSEEDRIPFNEISIFYTSLQKMSELIFNDTEQINMINIELFSKIIDLIKICTAKYLWKLVIQKRDFFDHLNGVKNIFLTFNGEFYFSFINKIKKLLNMPFDKKVEKDINDVFFATSINEVFNTDSDQQNFKIYSNFKIKLISAGFTYNFQSEEFKNYLQRNEITFLGAISYDLNILRFMNTIYKNQPGALWSLPQYDIDDEFIMSNSFTIKNFTKQREMNSFNTPLKTFRGDEMLKSSLIKGRKIFDNEDKMDLVQSKDENVSINYIIHISKGLENKNTIFNINDLIQFFQFQFKLKYNLDYNKPISLTFTLKYINRQKKILLNYENQNYKQVNDNEIEIFTRSFSSSDTDLGFLKNDKLINFQISFKDNYCSIEFENKGMNFGFPFLINQIISRDKRKMVLGLFINSDYMDIMIDINNWDFHFFSGEIYNENSNLILITYDPPWPHNFIFNDNVIKMYNLIFNLIFPLKTNLTLLNQLWIDKKKIKKENIVFRLIDSIHSEFVTFLQNLISFFMSDIIDLKFNLFFSKLKECRDFEELIKHHEEFLGDVINNTFVKSKKIMRIIFDILYTTRKFVNMVENILINLDIEEIEENTKDNLYFIREEFYSKKVNLINVFQKIKNSKYFPIISQLLTKIDFK